MRRSLKRRSPYKGYTAYQIEKSSDLMTEEGKSAKEATLWQVSTLEQLNTQLRNRMMTSKVVRIPALGRLGLDVKQS